ncbi:MAG: DUF3037 domain-containing protein [Streptosporangiales bacterium]|nr:DUF3037 domain-containing protein [Streptosporangiales bacterium]
MRHTFEYATLRAVPRVDRGEFVNVAVLLYCRGLDYLGCAVEVDEARVRMLDPGVDLDRLRALLETVRAICAGSPAAGPMAEGSQGERFRWLIAPRSTILQPGPVHTGLTEDPGGDLDRLLRLLVLPPAS